MPLPCFNRLLCGQRCTGKIQPVYSAHRIISQAPTTKHAQPLQGSGNLDAAIQLNKQIIPRAIQTGKSHNNSNTLFIKPLFDYWSLCYPINVLNKCGNSDQCDHYLKAVNTTLVIQI